MASQKRDDELSVGVEHENGWILVFALDPSRNQARHRSHSAHDQHGVLCCPVPIKSGFDVLVSRPDSVDVASQQQTLQ